LAIKSSNKNSLAGCFILIILSLASCVKHDEPKINEGSPLFSVSGTANGEPFTLAAGVNNYYMFTQTNTLDFGLTGLAGKLGKENCPGSCGPAIMIRFRNYTIQPQFYADSLLKTDAYSYYNRYNATHWVYQLKTLQRSLGNGTPKFGWDFGNSYFSSEAEPIVLFPVEGIYQVSCTGVYPDGCLSNLTQNIYLTPSRIGKHTDFSVNYIDTFQLLFNSIPVNTPADITWNFGDGSKASGSLVKHTYAKSGMYKVCMESIDGSDTMMFCQNVNTLDITACKTNFQFTTSRNLDSMQYKSVIVEWTDAAGVKYSTENVDQTGNFFVVQSVKPYLTNTQNQPTKQLAVSFSCKVSNGTETISLDHIKGTIAIALPSK
jgi:hypothetical protein